jgi:hypothetical protein
MSISSIFERVVRWFSATRRSWNVFFTTLLYLSGLVLYGIFFHWGNIPYNFMDWSEVNMPRLAFVQNALRAGLLPLHAADTAILRCGCDRFFSVPDAITTPLLIFLKWLPIGVWVLADIWLMYSLGFWALIRLRQRFKLAFPLFALAFLFLFFNGHILTHLAVGHLTWGGYFLFPWLVILVDRFIQGDDSWAWTFKSALLFLAIFLQGSFHQFVWSVILYAALSVTFWRRFWTVFRTLLAIALVSAFRILPPILALGNFDPGFYGGYPSLFAVYQSLTYWVSPLTAMPYQHLGSNLGYWEFDLYLGKLGFWYLILAGLAWLALQFRERKPAWIMLPMAVLVLLSFDDVFLLLRALPIPLLAGERVTSRIFSLPMQFYVLYTLSALAEWGRQSKLLRWIIPLISIPVVLIQGYTQARFLFAWRVTRSARAFPLAITDLSAKLASNHPDPLYFALLIGGGLLSLLSIALLAWLAYKPHPPSSFPSGRG